MEEETERQNQRETKSERKRDESKVDANTRIRHGKVFPLIKLHKTEELHAFLQGHFPV